MRLGVDVDLTLVDTGSEWWKWLSNYGNVHTERDILKFKDRECLYKLNYDLTKYFPDFMEKCLSNPFDFWKQEDLYDNLTPLQNSVEVLRQLVDTGHDIVFISHCHGGHFKSKVDWLKKHFSFTDIGGKGGFIATKEKYLVNVDVMIDDRIENLLNFPEEVVKIYFNTIYADNEFVKSDADIITSIDDGWLDIKEYFNDVGIL